MTENPGNTTEQSHGHSIVPSLIYHFFRIVLGAIFLIASLEKIERPWDFGRAIYVYEFLKGPLAYMISPMAIIMPFVELITGFLLIINRLVRPSTLLILGMNVIFMIAIASAMARGMDIDCGCGLDTGIIAAIAGTQAGWGAMIRDMVFVIMGLVVLFAGQSKGR